MFASAILGFFGGAGGPVGDFGGAGVSAAGTGAANVQVGLDFNADGSSSAYVTNGVGTSGDRPNWYAPTQGGIGAGYYIRATVTSGQAPSTGSTGVWQSLGSLRRYSYDSGTSGAYSSRGGAVLFEISPSAGGTPVVASGAYTFFVERES